MGRAWVIHVESRGRDKLNGTGKKTGLTLGQASETFGDGTQVYFELMGDI